MRRPQTLRHAGFRPVRIAPPRGTWAPLADPAMRREAARRLRDAAIIPARMLRECPRSVSKMAVRAYYSGILAGIRLAIRAVSRPH